LTLSYLHLLHVAARLWPWTVDSYLPILTIVSGIFGGFFCACIHILHTTNVHRTLLLLTFPIA
ncbi:hypothetical protein BDZ97DRAFT_1846137, partial [Flammula alnicola]